MRVFIVIFILCSCGNKDLTRQLANARKQQDVKWVNWYADKLEKQKALHDQCQLKINAAKLQSEVSTITAQTIEQLEAMWKDPDCPACEQALK